MDSGELRGSALFARDKDENDPFRLIPKATGALYNTNSAAATEALLDMFRQVRGSITQNNKFHRQLNWLW